ncbi:MAG TPA: SEC-C metal-binding domain-containing protein, partial [Casimicrobiaceae bacterium]|nr:SEC-C metal-binding domain-containing protein [Casimicrobiaceae bacterium]
MSATEVAAPPARNAPCPCGSGKRYKDCHGTLAPGAADWVRRALEELQARDFAAAEASLREAERLSPDDARIYANL